MRQKDLEQGGWRVGVLMRVRAQIGPVRAVGRRTRARTGACARCARRTGVARLAGTDGVSAE